MPPTKATCLINMKHSFPYNNIIITSKIHLYKYGQLVYLNISIYICLFITPGASAYGAEVLAECLYIIFDFY